MVLAGERAYCYSSLSEDEVMRELEWSRTEKIVARRAFDLGLSREVSELVRQFKEMAANAKDGPDLWKLECWLRARRREIESKYNFRYSVLPIVFAALLKQGYLSESDLDGLGQEKINLILSAAAGL
jgi:hypothetical protein